MMPLILFQHAPYLETKRRKLLSYPPPPPPVQQCQWLESHFTHGSITDRCLRYPEEAKSIIHTAELDLLKRDKILP